MTETFATETVDADMTRLQALRRNPDHAESLLEFARKRHVEEAIHFLSTVETFDEKVKEGVLELLSFFHSTFTLTDLSPSTRQDLLDAVSEEKYALKMFVPLRNEITAFLLNNILPKFVDEELSDFKAQVNQLNKVLRNQKTRKKFILATRKAGLGNAIDFWIQLEAVSERVAELAYAIWDTYISQGTDSQINISAQVVDNIQQSLLQFPDIHIFSEAYKHVAFLLAMDVVPDYLDSITSPQFKLDLSESRTIPSLLLRKPVLPRTKSFDAKNGKSILKEGKNYKGSSASSIRKKQQVQDRQLPEEFLVRTKPKSQIQKDLSKATLSKSTSKAQKLLGEECTIVVEKASDGCSIPVIGALSLAPAMAQQPSHVSLSKLKKMFGEVVPVQKFEDPEKDENSENYDDFSDDSPRTPSMVPRQQLRLKKFFGQTPDDKTNPMPIHEGDDDEDTLQPHFDKKEKKIIPKVLLKRHHQTPETSETKCHSEIVRKNKLARLLGEEVPESLIRRKPLIVLPELRDSELNSLGTPHRILNENPVEDYILLIEKGMEHMENFFDQRTDVVGKVMLDEQERQGFSEEQIHFMRSIVLKEVQLYRQEVLDQFENLQINILKSANFEMSRAEGAEANKLSDSQTELDKSLKHSNGPMSGEESAPEGKDVSGESPQNRSIIKYRHTKLSNDEGDNLTRSTSPKHLHVPSPRPPANRWEMSLIQSQTLDREVDCEVSPKLVKSSRRSSRDESGERSSCGYKGTAYNRLPSSRKEKRSSTREQSVLSGSQV